MTPQQESPPTAGHLFAGIDGFGYGFADRARTLWTAEIADYPRAVLELRSPGDHVRDVRDVRNPPPVDVLTGGFPCQDISLAGAGAGLRGARSGLWAEYARIIGEILPALVIIENVPALLRRGLNVVVRDLAGLGYNVEWDCLPASQFGAPHRRDRIWVLAHRRPGPCVFGSPASLFPKPPGDRWPRAGWVAGDPGSVLPLGPLAPVAGAAAVDWPTPKSSMAGPDYARTARARSGGDDLATAVARWPTPLARDYKDNGTRTNYARQRPGGEGPALPRAAGGPLNPAWVEWLMGFPVGWTDLGNDAPEPHAWTTGEPVPRTAQNVPKRRERLTALGNAVVPPIPAWLLRRFAEAAAH